MECLFTGGLYAIPARGEWVRSKEQMPLDLLIDLKGAGLPDERDTVVKLELVNVKESWFFR